MLSGKTAYIKGEKVTGNIPTKTISDLSADGKTVTVPAGYYAIPATKDVATGTATLDDAEITVAPAIVVDPITGKITAFNESTANATPTVIEGYITEGTTGTIVVKGESTSQLSTQSARTYTPTTKDQTVYKGKYLIGDLIIKGDENLKAENIKKDVEIFGITGMADEGIEPEGDVKITTTDPVDVTTYATATVYDTNLKAENIKYNTSILGIRGSYTSDATASASDLIENKTAYVDGKKITGTIKKKSSEVFTPTTTNQTISSGVYLSGTQTIKGDANLIPENIAKDVTIFGVTGTSTGMNTSDATATSSDIVAGKTAYIDGSKVTGTMPTRGADTFVPSTSDQTISSGVYLKGNITIKGDVDLTPTNIKSGVEIFGVTGTLTTEGGIIPVGNREIKSSAEVDVTNYATASVNDSFLRSTSIRSGLSILGVQGTFTNDATSVADDLRVGETAYVAGKKIVGTIEDYDGSYSGNGEIVDELTEYKLQQKTVYTNGVVVADEGYTGLSKVIVNIPVENSYFTYINNKVTTLPTNLFADNTKLTTLDVAAVTSIQSSVCRYCENLTTVSAPIATQLADSAFDTCTSLTYVNIPKVATLGTNCFKNCAELTTLRLSAATSIGSSAFHNCRSLKALIIDQSDTICSLGANAFEGCCHILGIADDNYNSTGSKDGFIYVPDSKVNTYKTTAN
jgi:hypothetical protein